MDNKKQAYEAPAVEVVELKMESGLLQASVRSTRQVYGTAQTYDWE